MEIEINELLTKIAHIIPSYSKKFHISEQGSRKFLRLAIIFLAKTDYKLEIIEDSIKGVEKKIEQLKREVINWNDDEFNDEDLEIIGYCQNIR